MTALFPDHLHNHREKLFFTSRLSHILTGIGSRLRYILLFPKCRSNPFLLGFVPLVSEKTYHTSYRHSYFYCRTGFSCVAICAFGLVANCTRFLAYGTIFQVHAEIYRLACEKRYD